MAQTEAGQGFLRRDQRRALHAYHCVGSVPEPQRGEYKIAVNDLGATILRSGLCAAIAAVQRRDQEHPLLRHLVAAGVPGLEGVEASGVARRVREIDAETYMIATRELLHVAVWLKRAVQATFDRA